MNGRVLRALTILTLSALTGCASGPFHRKPVPAPMAQPEAPELSQTPLYPPEMSDNTSHIPDLPTTGRLPVVQEPKPVVQKPKKVKKTKPSSATAKGSPAIPDKNTGAESSSSALPASGNQGAASATDTPSANPPADKKQPPTTQVAASGAAHSASPIGELTAGSAADAAETSHHTEDLIKTTRDGLDNVKRPLSADETKTAAEIRTFLARAQQALKNGDVDGAFGLATKAKLLLDELTGQ